MYKSAKPHISLVIYLKTAKLQGWACLKTEQWLHDCPKINYFHQFVMIMDTHSLHLSVKTKNSCFPDYALETVSLPIVALCSNVSFSEVVQVLCWSVQRFNHYNREHANFFLPFVLCLFGFNVIISPVSTCCVVRALLFPLCELFTGEAVLNIPATVK